MAKQVKCPECGSERVGPAAVPGLALCDRCGHVYPDENVEPAPPAPPEAIQVPDEHVEVPDEIEAAWGWRAWGVRISSSSGNLPLLQSVTHQEAWWRPRAPMVATCAYTTGRANGVRRKGHEVPDENCSCGLYAAKTLEHLLSMSYHRYDADAHGMFHVVGRVKLWGKVVEGTQGWRAAIGYPAELYVPYEAGHLIEPLEKAYGVDVMFKNTLAPASRKKR